jgi:DNA-binding CsgD family transcriptional regulator
MPVGFVGRGRELAVLRESVGSARAGQPQFVLVEGEGGCGKTSLLRAFQESLSGASLAVASGDEAEAGLHYGVLDEFARQLGQASQSAAWQLRGRGDPFAMGAAFLRLLEHASRSAPLVLTLDDAHLADGASMAALTFAARRLQADPVVVVLIARDDGVQQLPPGLLRLIQHRGTRIALAGLSVDEVQQLGLAVSLGQLSTQAATRLRHHTGGNPLHLRALLSELTLEQAETLDMPLPVPRSLATLVLGTVAATSPQAQQLAAAAAVLGPRSTLPVAATVAGLDDARAAADELTRAHVVYRVEEAEGTVLRFTHPLIRTAVYDDVGLVTRAMLHTRAADVTSGAKSLRHRVSAAQAPDPELVSALIAQAHSDQAHGRLGAAATALVSASHLSGPGPDKDQLLLQAIDLFLLEGNMASVMVHASTVGEMPRSARRLQVQARMAWLSGQFDEAESLGRQAWDAADDLEPSERDRLAAMLAQIAILQDKGAAAAEWAQRALASGLLPAELAVATRGTGALGLGVSGRARDGIALLGSLPADPARAMQEQQQLIGMRGLLRMFVDDLDAAHADLAIVVPSAYRGMRPHQLTALGALAEVEYRAGDWDKSASLAEQLVGLVEDTGQAWLLAFGHAECVLVSAGRGQWELAERHVEAARQGSELLGDAASRAYAESAAIHLAYCRGDLEGVALGAQPLLDDTLATTPREPGILWWPPQYASALVGLHRLDEADAALTDMERLARDRQHRSRQAALARARGELEAARRRTPEARAAFLEALRLGANPGDALETAVAHAAYGRFLRRRGERRNAVEQLSIAQELFTGLGADPFLARCESELAACGKATTGNAIDTAHTTLTPQELAVARLVAEGHRNQEIADELVLSVKTVSYHLGHVYTKLGIRSRTELASQWKIPAQRRET